MERDGKLGVHLDGSSGGRFSRLEVIEGPSGRLPRTKAERARIAAESLVPGASVTDVAKRHGTTRWQVYDWRKKLRAGQLVVPEHVAALPMFAELLVEAAAGAEMPAEREVTTGVQIVIGDVVIRVGANADEVLKFTVRALIIPITIMQSVSTRLLLMASSGPKISARVVIVR